MKNKFLSVLFVIPFTLVGCSISFSKTQLDEGFNGGGYPPEQEAIEYYGGDSFDNSLYSSYFLTAKTYNDVAESINEPTKLEHFIPEENISEVQNSFNDRMNHLISVVGYQYVCHANEGLEIGHLANKLSGRLILSFDVTIKYVELYMHPRVGVIANEFGYDDRIDEDVAVKVNDSKYITLSNEAALINTICKYKVSTDDEQANKLDINVYGNRAILEKIILYF